MSPTAKYLHGKKVHLRPLEITDTDFILEIVNNDIEVRKFTGTQLLFSREQIESYIRRQPDNESRVSFAIAKNESKEVVGEAVLNDISHINRSASFRIFIAGKHIGNGYGTEATGMLLDYGFGMLNLHRIELEVYTMNERAIHLYEKAGFKREGVKRENWYFDHDYYDSIMMSILKEEYRNAKSKTD